MNTTLQKEPLHTFAMTELLPPSHKLVVNINNRVLSLVKIGYSHEPIVQQSVLTPFAFRIFLLLLAHPNGCSEYYLLAAIDLHVDIWEALLSDLCTTILKTEGSLLYSSSRSPSVALPSPLMNSVTQWKHYMGEAQQRGAREKEIRFLQRQMTQLRQSLVAFRLHVPVYDTETGYRLAPLINSST